MQPNSNQPNQPPVPPQQPPQGQTWTPPPAAPVQNPTPPPAPSTQPGWDRPNFYGTTSYQQGPPPPPTPLPPPPPIEGPLAMTLPIWLKDHWKILTIIFFSGIVLLMIAFQLVYPSNWLLPGTKVDGVSLGYMRKQDAVTKLDNAYGEMQLAIYFGDNDAAFQTPKFKDIGIGVDTDSYLAPFEYPWYLRLVPTSFFWSGGFNKPGELEYVYDKAKIDRYIQSQVGDDCTIPARDASLKLVDDKLQLVASRPGGVCDITRFQQVLAATKPVPVGENKVNIDIRETAALVDDDKARVLAATLNDRASTPMPVAVGSSSQNIAGKSVLSWLDFKSFIPETPAGQPRDEDKIRNGSKLTFTVNRDRMSTFMAGDIGKKATVKPGVSKISTKDFTVLSRVDGQPGRELNKEATALTVESYLNKKSDKAIAETKVVPPTTSYTRSYSPTSTGFRALLTQWPEEHPGTYATSFVEVSGTKPYRKGSYRADQPALAAGVEAGYVGYAVVLGQQNGSILGSDIIAGRSPSQCFTDMIERTDQECIAGFMAKIGNETMIARGKELGLAGTTFSVTNTKTTAGDLTGFLNTAYLSKLAPSANGARILSTMQSTRLRDGIKAGLAKGTLANLAGESGTVRNDAAVVYSPKGIYLFIVMTEGASWEDIAALTRKVEGLHQILPPKVDS